MRTQLESLNNKLKVKRREKGMQEATPKSKDSGAHENDAFI